MTYLEDLAVNGFDICWIDGDLVGVGRVALWPVAGSAIDLLLIESDGASIWS